MQLAAGLACCDAFRACMLVLPLVTPLTAAAAAALANCAVVQEGDVMQLLQMDVDDDSQHTAALLSRSASAAAAAPAAPASRASSLGISAGHSDVSGSHSLRAQAAAGASKQAAAGAAAAAAGGTAGGFSFQMFGKDLTNSSKPQQVRCWMRLCLLCCCLCCSCKDYAWVVGACLALVLLQASLELEWRRLHV